LGFVDVTDRKLGLSTRAIHSRRAGAVPGEPVVMPIVQSATFAFERAEQFERVMDDEEHGYLYSSLRNPTVDELSGAVAALEGAEDAQAFASGMAAIASALLPNLAAGDTLLCPRQLYGNTYSFIERHVRPLGVEIVYLDVRDHAAWERSARVRYVETLANPGFPLADLRALAATKNDGLLVVDNTFASPALCRPLEHGADLVCESATKYLNGHHDVAAGVLAGRADLVEAARQHRYETGGVLDPFAAFLVRRGLKTLALRAERHSRNALELARFLSSHAAVECVRYVGLPSDPDHELALRQLDDSGGMLAFDVGTRAAAYRVLDALELCVRATSLGGVETLASHPASTSHRQLEPDQLDEAGISEGLLRVSVGCEDGDDLRADFERALEQPA
jgi:methionine-gamma-lyase